MSTCVVLHRAGNPYFNNKTKTVEPHLLHQFANDFYGADIRIILTGYLRPELNFNGLGASSLPSPPCSTSHMHIPHKGLQIGVPHISPV